MALIRLPWLLLALVPAAGACADLTPLLREGTLGVRVTHVHLPESLRKDLLSGLTNRIVLQVALLQDGAPVSRKVLDIAIKYDLWEENFTLRLTGGESGIITRTWTREDEVVAALDNLSLPRLFAGAPLAARGSLTITADVLFNPVEKERLEEIRRWVAENSTVPPGGTYGAGLPPASAASQSRALFNRIFAQYASGASLAAAWKDSGTTIAFRLKDLREEP
jgi:hypothetical protein